MRYDEHGNIDMTDKEMVRTGRRWIIIGIAAIVILPSVFWGISVVTSGPKGRGNQVRQINKADNRTFAQEQFHQLYEDIKAYDVQIGIAGRAVEQHPTQDTERARLAQVYFGLQTQCTSTAAQYDAEAQKISKRQFLDAGLPDHIDSLDPATDCKETRS